MNFSALSRKKVVPQWILNSLFIVCIYNCNLYILSWNRGLIFALATPWRYQHRPSSLRSIDESPKPRRNMIMKEIFVCIYYKSHLSRDSTVYVSDVYNARAFIYLLLFFMIFLSFTRKPMRTQWDMKDHGKRDRAVKTNVATSKMSFFFSISCFSQIILKSLTGKYETVFMRWNWEGNNSTNTIAGESGYAIGKIQI